MGDESVLCSVAASQSAETAIFFVIPNEVRNLSLV